MYTQIVVSRHVTSSEQRLRFYVSGRLPSSCSLWKFQVRAAEATWFAAEPLAEFGRRELAAFADSAELAAAADEAFAEQLLCDSLGSLFVWWAAEPPPPLPFTCRFVWQPLDCLFGAAAGGDTLDACCFAPKSDLPEAPPVGGGITPLLSLKMVSISLV